MSNKLVKNNSTTPIKDAYEKRKEKKSIIEFVLVLLLFIIIVVGCFFLSKQETTNAMVIGCDVIDSNAIVPRYNVTVQINTDEGVEQLNLKNYTDTFGIIENGNVVQIKYNPITKKISKIDKVNQSIE